MTCARAVFALVLAPTLACAEGADPGQSGSNIVASTDPSGMGSDDTVGGVTTGTSGMTLTSESSSIGEGTTLSLEDSGGTTTGIDSLVSSGPTTSASTSVSTESSSSISLATLVLTDSDTGSSTGGSSSDGPSACALSEMFDFLSCAGWTSGALMGNTTWACGNPSAYLQGPGTSHMGVWATNLTGDYQINESSYVASPSFSFLDCTTISLTVEHWHNFEGGANNLDGGIVQLSTDGGETWQTIAPSSGDVYYTSEVLQTAFAPPNGEHGFSGLGDNKTWKTSTFSLDGFAGEIDVTIRFVFGSDAMTVRAGWYIDTVTLTGS